MKEEEIDFDDTWRRCLELTTKRRWSTMKRGNHANESHRWKIWRKSKNGWEGNRKNGWIGLRKKGFFFLFDVDGKANKGKIGLSHDKDETKLPTAADEDESKMSTKKSTWNRKWETQRVEFGLWKEEKKVKNWFRVLKGGFNVSPGLS